jgi:hypothetical protein
MPVMALRLLYTETDVVEWIFFSKKPLRNIGKNMSIGEPL